MAETKNPEERGLRLVKGEGSTLSPSEYIPFASLPDVCTTAQAADALQVDPKTVRGMVRRGELKAVRCGRLLRIPKRALLQLCGGGE